MDLETAMNNMISLKGSGPREGNATTIGVMVLWLKPQRMLLIISHNQPNGPQVEQQVLAAIRAHMHLTLILCEH